LPFPVEKKPTFTEWCKKNKPEVYREFEILILHRL